VIGLIYTLTLNPSIDYYMSINNIALGEVNRSVGEHLAFGGKGINASRILNSLGHKSRAVAVVGDGCMSEVFLNGVKSEGLDVTAVRAEGDVRINVKLNGTGCATTELNGVGVKANRATLDGITLALTMATEGDIVVMSGSVCQGLHVSIYQTLTEKLNSRGVFTVVDADGEALANAIKAKPYLIKPNKAEFERLTGEVSDKTEDIIKASRRLNDLGVKNVLVSLGEMGAVIVGDTEHYIPAERVKVVNTVGAGDSLLAGYVCGMNSGLEPYSCLLLGLDSASMRVSSEL
jgi:1-phosphofructokinase